MAFFAFLRCGEFTTATESFDPTIHLTLTDVSLQPTVSPTTATLHIKVAKTDPFRRGCYLHVFRNNSTTCPILALCRYLHMRSKFHVTSEALFVLPSGQMMTRSFFVSSLRHLLQRLGLPQDLYCGHSFRSGAATSAARAKIPDHLIRVLGRWNSDCYQRYIHTPTAHIHWAQQHMNMLAQH